MFLPQPSVHTLCHVPAWITFQLFVYQWDYHSSSSLTALYSGYHNCQGIGLEFQNPDFGFWFVGFLGGGGVVGCTMAGILHVEAFQSWDLTLFSGGLCMHFKISSFSSHTFQDPGASEHSLTNWYLINYKVIPDGVANSQQINLKTSTKI